MKIGNCSLGYYETKDAVNYTYEDGFKSMAAHGYHCIDCNDLDDYKSDLFKLSDEEFRAYFTRMKACADQYGIEIYQMHGIWLTVNFDKTDEDRAATLGYYVKQMQACNYLGCKYLVIHPFMPFGFDVEGDFAFTLEVNRKLLRDLIPHAEQWGVTVCVENLPFPNNPMSRVTEVKKLVSEIGHPKIKVCLDTGHANIFSNDIAADVRLLGNDLATLHVHDNYGKKDDHLLPYHGSIKWDEFLASLTEIGYNGCFNLETYIGERVPEPYLGELQIALARLAQFMADKV